MVQSTINSQCGRLQSARSHAISSTFQAQFSSAFDVVSLSTQVQGCDVSTLQVITARDGSDEIDRGVRVCEITAQLQR